MDATRVILSDLDGSAVETTLEACFPDLDEAYQYAKLDLAEHGEILVGGGAAPARRLTLVDPAAPRVRTLLELRQVKVADMTPAEERLVVSAACRQVERDLVAAAPALARSLREPLP